MSGNAIIDFLTQLSWPVLLILVFSSMYLLSGLMIAASRIITRQRMWAPIQTPVMQVTSVYLALLLAFLITNVLKELSDARSAVQQEVVAIEKLRALTDVLENETKKIFHGHIDQYIQAVIDEDWPEMIKGGESHKTKEILDRLLIAAMRLDSGERGPVYANRAIINTVNDIIVSRTVRHF